MAQAGAKRRRLTEREARCVRRRLFHSSTAAHLSTRPPQSEVLTLFNCIQESVCAKAVLDMVSWLIVVLYLFGTLYSACLLYIAWRKPIMFKNYISKFARLHRDWNPGQASWMESHAYFWLLRVIVTAFFGLCITATAALMLRIVF